MTMRVYFTYACSMAGPGRKVAGSGRDVLGQNWQGMKVLLPNSVAGVVCRFIFSMLLGVSASYAEPVRPFWTEKSSYIEGGYLYVVGIASNAPSVEAGRERAFANGKNEIMNFTQLSNLEGLIIRTQMTFQEKVDNRFNVYRLMFVDYEDVNALKNRSIELTRRNYERFQEKQEREIAIRKNALTILSKTRDEIAVLDREYYRILGDVQNASDKAVRYVKVGMSRGEIERLLGFPRSISKHFDGYVHDSKYGDYWVIYDHTDTVVCLSTSTKCVRENCNTDGSRCVVQGQVSYYNRMRELE